MALILYPVTFTVITTWFATERARAFAVLTVLGGLASPIFLPLAGWLIPQWGWRTTLLSFGLAHFLFAVPLHAGLVLRPPPHKQEKETERTTTSQAAARAASWSVR